MAVYQGSVVVDYQITAEEDTAADATTSSSTLASIKRNLNTLVEEAGAETFGAPVLSASSDGEVVIEDPDYVAPVAANVGVTRQYTKTAIYGDIAPDLIVETENVTVIEEEETETVLTPETLSLLGVLGAMAVIFLCCVGSAGLIFCYMKNKAAREITKAVQKKQTEMKYRDQPKVDLDSSDANDINMASQYHPDDDVKVDIYDRHRVKHNRADEIEATGIKPAERRFDDSNSKLMNLSAMTAHAARPSNLPLKNR